jgi:hypothetical protein
MTTSHSHIIRFITLLTHDRERVRVHDVLLLAAGAIETVKST